jgi:hypothetical protein
MVGFGINENKNISLLQMVEHGLAEFYGRVMRKCSQVPVVKYGRMSTRRDHFHAYSGRENNAAGGIIHGRIKS